MTTRLYDPLTYENLMLGLIMRWAAKLRMVKTRRETEEKVRAFFGDMAA